MTNENDGQSYDARKKGGKRALMVWLTKADSAALAALVRKWKVTKVEAVSRLIALGSKGEIDG